ncbi:MAG: hypothetical protein OER43_02450 [Gammaproteobacteria bacterium]|nr:hypothetical protein [Gammaproteobacteria bacterium]MDH3413020.1 hypothetical protein [Gammaproteobacteria bacterium]
MARLRQRGLVTAVVCSGPFIKLGRTQAKVFGVPDLPLLEIAHPLGGLGLEEVNGRADVALAQFLKLINSVNRET